ncbi:MAG: hypothetical protein ABW185_21510 [Sedimenticola sp.]
MSSGSPDASTNRSNQRDGSEVQSGKPLEQLNPGRGRIQLFLVSNNPSSLHQARVSSSIRVEAR